MMKSFSQVVGSIACPDSEAGNISPELWPPTKGPFAKSLSEEQHFYMHKYLKSNPQYGITRASWNDYFQVKNVTEAIQKSLPYKNFCATSQLVVEQFHQHPILEKSESWIFLRRRMSNLTTKAWKFLLLALLHM